MHVNSAALQALGHSQQSEPAHLKSIRQTRSARGKKINKNQTNFSQKKKASGKQNDEQYPACAAVRAPALKWLQWKDEGARLRGHLHPAFLPPPRAGNYRFFEAQPFPRAAFQQEIVFSSIWDLAPTLKIKNS